MFRAMAGLVAAVLAAVPCQAQAQAVVIRNARVFDGRQATDHLSVVVQGGLIRSVGRSVRIPAGAQVVEAEGKTLLPGLIDAHVHTAVEGAGALRKALLFGVTTVLDLFHPVPAELAKLRQLAVSGANDVADLRSAGICATVPKGHGTEFGYPIPTIERMEDAQGFVDARIAEGSDYIKIIHSTKSGVPQTSAELVRALVAAAHRRNRITLVCIRTAQDAMDAMEAGADGLAHLPQAGELPPDFGRIAARGGLFVIPTAAVILPSCRPRFDASVLADRYLAPFLTPSDVANLGKAIAPPPSNVCGNFVREIAQLKAAGVPILAGTDAPNPSTSYGAGLHGELRLLNQLGLSPAESLAAATSLPARVFHLEDRGRIEPGKRADLLLVEGNPLEDIENTRRIAGIWRNGKRIDREALR